MVQNNSCDYCCNPQMWGRDELSYQTATLNILCSIVSALGGTMNESFDTCHPCSCPTQFATTKESFRASELTLLCEILRLLTVEPE